MLSHHRMIIGDATLVAATDIALSAIPELQSI
jgi:hypothetical protein